MKWVDEFKKESEKCFGLDDIQTQLLIKAIEIMERALDVLAHIEPDSYRALKAKQALMDVEQLEGVYKNGDETPGA